MRNKIALMTEITRIARICTISFALNATIYIVYKKEICTTIDDTVQQFVVSGYTYLWAQKKEKRRIEICTTIADSLEEFDNLADLKERPLSRRN